MINLRMILKVSNFISLIGVFVITALASGAQIPQTPTALPKLDLNKASLADLAKLPGVGEGTAKKIIAGRPYKAIADLEKVGIPKANVEKIAPLVTVGSESAVSSPTATGQQPAQKGMVWVNTDSGIFFREGDRWYGKTKEGKFMSEADAIKAGYRESKP